MFLSNWLHSHYLSVTGSLVTVFWSLFGKVELGEFETEPTFIVIKVTALLLFAVFNVFAVLVALNILIAMLNNSFTQNTVS